MNSTQLKLLGLLGVQLVLGLVTWNQGSATDGARDARALVPGKLAGVTALKVTSKPPEGEEAKTLSLVKEGDTWKVASAGNYPAKTDKVEDVVNKILGIQVREPLATSAANHNALRVGDREYDKVIEVTVDGKPLRLVLGSAKGTSVHVRAGEDPNVYWANGVSTWALSDQVSGYVDTEYVKADNLVKVQVTNKAGSFDLTKDQDGDWTVNPAPSAGQLKQAEVTGFLDKVKSVRLAEPVGTEVKAEYGLDGSTKVVLVSEAKAEGAAEDAAPVRTETSFELGAAKGDQFYCKAEGQPFVVLVNKWAVEKILDKKAGDFLKDLDTAPPAGE